MAVVQNDTTLVERQIAKIRVQSSPLGCFGQKNGIRKMETETETRTKTCGPYPGLILTHTQLASFFGPFFTFPRLDWWGGG